MAGGLQTEAKRQEVMRLLSELAQEDSSIADRVTDWLGSFKEIAGGRDNLQPPGNNVDVADVEGGLPIQGGRAVGSEGTAVLSDVAREEAGLLASHRHCWSESGDREEEEREMERVKHEVFGIPPSSPFSSMQLRVLRALTCRPPMDVLAVMKAGAGKSLCFHVASVMSGRVTLVISPFRALIRNHLASLSSCPYGAAMYVGETSSLSPSSVCLSHKRLILEAIRGNHRPWPHTLLHGWCDDGGERGEGGGMEIPEGAQRGCDDDEVCERLRGGGADGCEERNGRSGAEGEEEGRVGLGEEDREERGDGRAGEGAQRGEDGDEVGDESGEQQNKEGEEGGDKRSEKAHETHESDLPCTPFFARGGALQCLYVTPEMLETNRGLRDALLTCYQQDRLSLAVIDEAHHYCLSDSSGYRKAMSAVGSLLRTLFPTLPMLAITATANESVREEIRKHLCMWPDTLTFTAPVRISNIHYSVQPKPKKASVADAICAFVRAKYPAADSCQMQEGRGLQGPQQGLVYCWKKEETVQLAASLSSLGLPSLPYHSSLAPEVKDKHQDKWRKSEVQILVCTYAFGSGIHQPHVRFVIHTCIPRSLESFYQESGRAGRDGLKAHSVVFFSLGDLQSLKRVMLNNSKPSCALRSLNAMADFCINKATCRHELLLRHFDCHDAATPVKCDGWCDNCSGALQSIVPQGRTVSRDFTEHARSLLLTLRLCRSKLPPTLRQLLLAHAKRISEANEDLKYVSNWETDGRRDERRMLQGQDGDRGGGEGERERKAGSDEVWVPSKSEMDHLAVRLMALGCLSEVRGSETNAVLRLTPGPHSFDLLAGKLRVVMDMRLSLSPPSAAQKVAVLASRTVSGHGGTGGGVECETDSDRGSDSGSESEGDQEGEEEIMKQGQGVRLLRANQKRQWDVMDQMKSLFTAAPLKKIKDVRNTWHKMRDVRALIPTVGEHTYDNDVDNCLSVMNQPVEEYDEYSSRLFIGVRQSPHELVKALERCVGSV